MLLEELPHSMILGSNYRFCTQQYEDISMIVQDQKELHSQLRSSRAC